MPLFWKKKCQANRLFPTDENDDSGFDVFGALHQRGLTNVMAHICQYLDHGDIAKLFRICHSWHDALHKVDIWRALLLKRHQEEEEFRRIARMCDWSFTVDQFDYKHFHYVTTDGWKWVDEHGSTMERDLKQFHPGGGVSKTFILKNVLFAALGQDRDFRILAWELTDSKSRLVWPNKIFDGHSNSIYCISVDNPDECGPIKLFASGSRFTWILWDYQSGAMLRTFMVKSDVTSITFTDNWIFLPGHSFKRVSEEVVLDENAENSINFAASNKWYVYCCEEDGDYPQIQEYLNISDTGPDPDLRAIIRRKEILDFVLYGNCLLVKSLKIKDEEANLRRPTIRRTRRNVSRPVVSLLLHHNGCHGSAPYPMPRGVGDRARVLESSPEMNPHRLFLRDQRGQERIRLQEMNAQSRPLDQKLLEQRRRQHAGFPPAARGQATPEGQRAQQPILQEEQFVLRPEERHFMERARQLLRTPDPPAVNDIVRGLRLIMEEEGAVNEVALERVRGIVEKAKALNQRAYDSAQPHLELFDLSKLVTVSDEDDIGEPPCIWEVNLIDVDLPFLKLIDIGPLGLQFTHEDPCEHPPRIIYHRKMVTIDELVHGGFQFENKLGVKLEPSADSSTTTKKLCYNSSFLLYWVGLKHNLLMNLKDI